MSVELVPILLADGDPLARGVVRGALEGRGGFDVVAETGDADDALVLCAEHVPRVVVLEPELRDGAASDLVKAMRALPGAPDVLVFSRLDDDDVAVDAVRAGANGYVRKTDGVDAVVVAVEAMLRGEIPIDRVLTMRVIELLRDARHGPRGLRPVHGPLGPREWEVLDLLSDGESTRDISGRLVLSELTVHSHIKSILRKLGVHSRAEAVARLRELRTEPDDEAS
jgi:DNA-binding NarL/FixJ family response regulator